MSGMRPNDHDGPAARTHARSIAMLGAAILIGSLAACARISSFFSPPAQPVTPVAQATVVATATPTPAVISVHHRHRKKGSHGKRPPENSEMAKGGMAAPSAKPSPDAMPEDSGLTLENDDATMRQA